jgi:hypothetical protein
MIEDQRVLQVRPIPSTDLPRARQSGSRWREVAPAVAVVVAGLGARLAWHAATHYTFEDAFITFQFARRLAAGQGFVYNTGQPVYGTTTPLFALLVAGWLKVFPENVVAGAWLLGLLASAGGLALTWAVLSESGVTARGRICVLALLAVSDKLWLFDTGGMETPLLFCFMMAALYAHLRGWPIRAGFAAGLLLWTRVDLVTWPAALVLGYLWRKKRLPGRLLASTALAYLPWLIFATLRFGSPVPHTITAKWVHYQMGIASSPGRAAGALFAWISPFGAYEIATVWQIGLAGGTLLLATWGALKASARPGLDVLWIFVLLEATRIVLTGATFEERYFVPMLSTTLVLAGLGLAAMLSRLSGERRSWAAWTAAAAAGCAGTVFFAHGAPHYRDVELFRHERSLMAVGNWLNAHTPRGASVLLEPLGYAGYFADRRMIDEVGLVSPQVVQLGRQNHLGDSVAFSRVLLSKIQPDYFVAHCDDALEVFTHSPSEHDIQKHYSRQAVFNPMNFKPGESPERPIARRSCYEIWGR